MNQTDDAIDGPGFETGRALWRRCRTTEIPEDDAERFLDLAGFADGMLDDRDEHDRVAALVAANPVAASDIAAARALTTGGVAMPGGLEPIINRAAALVDDETAQGRVIPFAVTSHRMLHDVAQWGGLAAAIAFASWLGFAMGSGASLTMSQPIGQRPMGDESFLPELLDPSMGFLRDLGEGRQT